MFISNWHKPATNIITLQFIPLYSLRGAVGICVLQTGSTSSFLAEHSKKYKALHNWHSTPQNKLYTKIAKIKVNLP
jgi:hypothetical protein